MGKLYFVLLMKSHLQSYPCPLQINFFWNLGFLLGVAIILQIITGIFLALHYTSDLNSAYYHSISSNLKIYYLKSLYLLDILSLSYRSWKIFLWKLTIFYQIFFNLRSCSWSSRKTYLHFLLIFGIFL